MLLQALGLALQTVATTAVCAAIMFLGVVGVGPHTGRYQVATVLSGSMRPTFEPGSILFATRVDATAIRVGDVVMAHVPLAGRPVVAHRVVSVRRTQQGVVVRTKGDANGAPDAWEVTMLGQAWRVRTNAEDLGYVIEALRRPDVQRVLGRVVPVLLSVVWLTAIWRPRADESPIEAAAHARTQPLPS